MNRPSPKMESAGESIEALNRRLFEGVVRPLGLDSGVGTAELVKSLTASSVGAVGATVSATEIVNDCSLTPRPLWATTVTLNSPIWLTVGVQKMTPVSAAIVIPSGDSASAYVGAGDPVAYTSYV